MTDLATIPGARRVERIGTATLILGDNQDVAHLLPRPAMLIGDPPYGQKLKVNVMEAGGTRRGTVLQRNGKMHAIHPRFWPAVHGDDKPFDPQPWLGLADTVLLWGAHRFGHRLPAGSTLVWDKVPNGKVRDQGDGEIAWLSGPVRPVRIHRLLWDGICVGAAARHEVTAGQQRVHPTQKPVVLMEWCLQQAGARAGHTILDPWMGAGSTGIAAVRAGCIFTGIELVPEYFDTACRRIEAAQRQGDMLLQAAE